MASGAGPATSDSGQHGDEDDGYILVDVRAPPATKILFESAAITEYREDEEYGEYRMELVRRGLPTVTHWLRYKQYERLHKMLKKLFKGHDFGFPKSTAGGVRGSIRKGLNKVTGGMQLGKKLAGTGGDTFVTYRLEGLDAFIRGVAGNNSFHGVLQEFLAVAASSADGIGTGDGGPAVPAGLTAEEATEEDAAAIDRIDAVLEDLREFLDIAPLPDGLELADELDKLAAESITIPVTVDSSPEPPPSGPAVGGTDTALGHLGESGEDTASEAAAADGDRRAEEWSSSSKVSLAESALAAESPPTPAGDPLKAAASKSQAIAGYLTSRSKGSNPFALEMMAMDRQTEVFAPLPLPLLEHFLAYLYKQEELQLEALNNVFRRRTETLQARIDELEAQDEYHAHTRNSSTHPEVSPVANAPEGGSGGGDISPTGLGLTSTGRATSPEDEYINISVSPSSVDSSLAESTGGSPPTVVALRSPTVRRDVNMANRGTVWFPPAPGDERAATAATPVVHAAHQMRGSAPSAPAEHRSTLWDPLRIPEIGESTTTPSPVRIAMPPPPPPPEEGGAPPRRTAQL